MLTIDDRYDVYKGPANAGPSLAAGAQFPVNDPLYLVPAMAAATKNLAFGITASTTYDAPYSHARRFSSVDHYSNGRVAWNIVTSYLESAAKSHGLDTQIEHDERYRKADEYMDVLYKLWEGSWADDAVIEDKVNDVYAVDTRVQKINHNGKYFSCAGPHICEPSPQRTPFLFQAGISASGREFGAKHAEAIFVGAATPEALAPNVKAIRDLARDTYGRDPSSIKIMCGMTIIAAATDEDALAKERELQSYGNEEGALALLGGWIGVDVAPYSEDEDLRFAKDPKLAGIISAWADSVEGGKDQLWNRKRVADHLVLGGPSARVTGGPAKVADELERWVRISGVDGFNLAHVVSPGSFEDIIEFVLPELRRRGLFHEGVPEEKVGVTAREAYLGHGPWLREDHHGRKFRWEAGKPPPVFPDREEFTVNGSDEVLVEEGGVLKKRKLGRGWHESVKEGEKEFKAAM
jgi:FMN-dependent oxidoreductase (nitrilotriacetate monooxygenase family)